MEHVKAGWRRTTAAVELDRSQLGELMGPIAGGRPIRAATRLGGGLGNTNYCVTFDDSVSYVLRLYTRDPRALEKERMISATVRPHVPAPRFVHADASRDRVPYPYAITEWIEGRNAAELLPGADAAACAAMARSMGGALAPLQRHTFPCSGFLDAHLQVSEPLDMGGEGFVELMRLFLFDRGGAYLLGEDEARRFWRCIESAAGELDVLRHYPPNLVHSDFGPENVLVSDDLRVTGVLDWEFARSGSSVGDIGQVLRPPWDDDPAIADAFAQGFVEAGGELPDNWQRLARLEDLVAWAEFLSRPDPTPELIRTCRAVIEKRVRQLAPRSGDSRRGG